VESLSGVGFIYSACSVRPMEFLGKNSSCYSPIFPAGRCIWCSPKRCFLLVVQSYQFKHASVFATSGWCKRTVLILNSSGSKLWNNMLGTSSSGFKIVLSHLSDYSDSCIYVSLFVVWTRAVTRESSLRYVYFPLRAHAPSLQYVLVHWPQCLILRTDDSEHWVLQTALPCL
jgi:hypothetical protein